MTEIIIRPYQSRDREAVRRVCLATSDYGPKNTEVLYTLYCDYYIEQEPENVFVADADGEAAGYVLCAEDEKKYLQNYKKHYFKRLKKASKLMFLSKLLENAYNRRFAKAYPAHLHIDIEPPYQRQGVGHRLMDALISELGRKGIKGVRLTVAADNKKGVNFYLKYGFEKLASPGGRAYVMGYKIKANTVDKN